VNYVVVYEKKIWNENTIVFFFLVYTTAPLLETYEYGIRLRISNKLK